MGGYKCDCVLGYEKVSTSIVPTYMKITRAVQEPSDHTRCKAMQGHPALIFTQKQSIRNLALDRKIMTSVINTTRSACAVDYSYKMGLVFWSDIMEEKIYR